MRGVSHHQLTVWDVDHPHWKHDWWSENHTVNIVYFTAMFFSNIFFILSIGQASETRNGVFVDSPWCTYFVKLAQLCPESLNAHDVWDLFLKLTWTTYKIRDVHTSSHCLRWLWHVSVFWLAKIYVQAGGEPWFQFHRRIVEQTHLLGLLLLLSSHMYSHYILCVLCSLFVLLSSLIYSAFSLLVSLSLPSLVCCMPSSLWWM